MFLSSVTVNSFTFQIAFHRWLLNHAQKLSWKREQRLPQTVLSSEGWTFLAAAAEKAQDMQVQHPRSWKYFAFEEKL